MTTGRNNIRKRGSTWTYYLVGGHEMLPTGGHVAARWWPTDLPGGGQLFCPR